MNTLQESQISSRKKSKTLRVAFICTTVSGVAKYRMGSFAWQMRKFPNVETVFWPYSAKTTIQNPWQVDMLTMPDIMRTIDNFCDRADVIVWQALDFPHSFDLWQSMKARHQKPFLMEIDDYVADVPVGNEAYQQFKPGSKRTWITRTQMKLSDGLVVSTPYLAKQYESMNEKIYVVPNSIDFTEWAALGSQKHDRIRIGWIGGGTHGTDLEMIAPVMEELLSKYWKENVWFYCIHGCPQIYKGWPRVYHTLKWAPINLYPKFMNSFNFDIGIAPLEDNNFNRGKSNLRYLEYSALKLPCVASPLPDFSRTITHGKNGFLANDADTWRDCLEELIKSESLRREMGRHAYQTIRDNFNVTKTANQYRHILQEFV